MLWAGLLALTLQGLAPFCISHAFAAEGGSSMVICTAHGAMTVYLDADGKPVKPSSDQNSNCPTCTSFHSLTAFAPPVPGQLVPPAAGSVAPRILASAAIAAKPCHFSYVTRAPPALNA